MDLSTIIGIGAAFGLMLMAILQGGPLTIFINVKTTGMKDYLVFIISLEVVYNVYCLY